MESRLTELEIKISYTEDTVEALNILVFRQQQQIDRLIAEICTLREQIQNMEPKKHTSLRDEIPPHY